jgi:chitodextrinase
VLSEDGQSPAAMGLSWTDTTTGTFTNYTIFEASAATNWALSGIAVITSAGTTTYVASGISPATDYDWEVTENYQTCVLLFCSGASQTTNLLNVTQPAVAFLNDTGVTSTSATLEWTNNATYGGLISFTSYTVWQEFNGGAATLVATITAQATTQYLATLTAGASYSFYVRTSDCTSGCGGGSPSNSVTQSDLITLGTPQTLSVSMFAEQMTTDLGQTDYYVCTPTGGESPFSYQWNFATGTYVAGNASESVALGSTGVQTVDCEVTDHQPVQATGSVTVDVNSALKVTVSGNRSTADVGQTISFLCTPSGGTTPYTLSWALGDGTQSTLPGPTHAYSVAAVYAPTCSVSDGAGAKMAPSVPLVISPTLDVSASATALAAAPGTLLTFTAVASNGSGTYPTYTWNFGAGVTASGATVTHSFSSAADVTVTATVVDSNGGSATGTVVVDVSPIVIAVQPTPTSITNGSAVTFTASASGGAGAPYNYTWNFGDGKVGYGASVSHTYSATGTDTPTLTVRDRLGATNVTALAKISVNTPAPPYSWFTGWVALGIALLVGIVIAIVVLARRRSSEAAELEKASGAYVPPTDPKRTIKGAKICAFCGASNLPIRTTCSHCGKPLSR